MRWDGRDVEGWGELDSWPTAPSTVFGVWADSTVPVVKWSRSSMRARRRRKY